MEETEKEIAEASPQQPTAGNVYLVPGAIIVAGLLIAGAVVYSNAPRSTSPDRNTAAIGGSIAGDLSDDDPLLGDPQAPVTMVEFGDFQCPFCRRLFETTLSDIKEKYVATGKVKFIYRDFPLSSIHSEAEKAAEAGECADEQGKFWALHDLLYERQDALGVANYKKWAAEIGLNAQQFNECLDSGKYAEEVAKDLADGQAAGVNGTPATFINGRLVSGAVPFAQFEVIIEEELKKSK